MYLSSCLLPGPPGSHALVNLSASEIQRLADRIIANSKAVHDRVASVPLDKVSTSFELVLPFAITNRMGSQMSESIIATQIYHICQFWIM